MTTQDQDKGPELDKDQAQDTQQQTNLSEDQTQDAALTVKQSQAERSAQDDQPHTEQLTGQGVPQGQVTAQSVQDTADVPDADQAPDTQPDSTLEVDPDHAHFCDDCGAANPLTSRFCQNCGALLPFVHTTGALPEQTLLANRYQLVNRIGQGGMGAVYKALDTSFSDRPVALKEMSSAGLSPTSMQEAEDAFTHEAHLLAGLLHPNLPRIYDHFTENDRSYLVMDFIEGETLEEYLDKNSGPQPLSKVLNWAEQICDVLSYLHTQQPPVIFRDLKPSNIMVSTNGHIYLIDFGIARIFKPGKQHDTVALGSPGYAAPEQYGKAQSSPRSDIYSLGAVLHYLLTGVDPSDQPFFFQPASLLNPGVSQDLQMLLQQMLEMDAQKRPASAQFVLDELHRCASGAPTTYARTSPTTDPLLEQAQQLYTQKRLDEALTAYNTVLQRDTTSSLGWQGYALTQGLRSRHKDALDAFERALKLNPTLVTSWNGKGTALSQLKRPQEALQAFERALELDQKNAAAWNGKGAALNMLGRTDQALRSFDTALRYDPQMAQAWNNKGLILNQQKRYGDALFAFDQALKQNPQLATSLSGRGTALLELGRRQEALQAFERACQLSPALVHAWSGRGLALYELGRLKDARRMFETALSLDDKYAPAYFGKGQVLYAERKLKEAQNAFELAIRYNSNYAEAWSRRGNVIDELGDYINALQSYEQALRLNPRYAPAWSGKAGVLRQLGRHYEALRAYESALNIDARFALAWNGKGNTLYNLNNYGESLKAYERALQLNPRLTTAWHNKALVLNRMHRYDEALRAAEEAIRQRSDDPDHWLRKAEALRGLRRKQEARQAEEQAKYLRGGN